jgi:hypothetical protein
LKLLYKISVFLSRGAGGNLAALSKLLSGVEFHGKKCAGSWEEMTGFFGRNELILGKKRGVSWEEVRRFLGRNFWGRGTGENKGKRDDGKCLLHYVQHTSRKVGKIPFGGVRWQDRQTMHVQSKSIVK